MNISESGLNKKEFNDLGGTLNELAAPTDVSDNDVIESVNWKVHRDGKSRVLRPGSTKYDQYYDFGGKPVRGLFDFWDENGDSRVVAVLSNEIWILDTDGLGWTQIYSQVNELAGPVKMVAFNRERPILVGMDTNLMIEPTQAVLLGVEAPLTGPTLAEGAANGLTGVFKYAVTYYRSGNFPVESNPSPISAEIDVTAHKVDLTDIPVSADPKIDTKRIYRTTAGGEILFWLDDIPNATTIYTDDWTGDLGSQMSYARYVPTTADLVEVWDEKIWLVPKDYPNQLHFTNSGTAEEMAYDNIVQVRSRDSDKINGIKAFSGSLFVFKSKSQMYRVDKIGESSYELTLLPFATGCEASASIDVMGQPGLMIWKSKFGIEAFNGETIFRPPLSELIPKTLATINQSSIEKSVGAVNEKESEYWLAVPTGDATEPNLVIVLDCLKGSVTTYEFPKTITALHNIRDANSNLMLLSASSDGEIYKQGVGYTDDGTVIDGHFKLKLFRMATGERAVWNVFRRMFLEFILQAGRKMRVKFYSNFDQPALGWIDVEGSGEVQAIKRIDLGIRAAYFGIEFEMDQDPNGECRILGFDGYFKRRFWKRDIKETQHG